MQNNFVKLLAIFFGTILSFSESYAVQFYSESNCGNILAETNRTCKIRVYRYAPLTAASINFVMFGTATYGSDYSTSLTSIDFAEGQTEAFFNLDIYDDTLVEGSESIQISVDPTSGHTFSSSLNFGITMSDRNPENRSVEITASVNVLNSSITLDWQSDLNYHSFNVFRRELGQVAWGSAVANLPIGVLTYQDFNVQLDKIYEYKVERPVGVGFITVAYGKSAVHNRGRLLILAEEVIAKQLSSEISKWRDQISGDGWDVLYEQVSQTDSAPNIKNKIISRYTEVDGLKAVILFGHVPVPYSGNILPDGHTDHRGAWPADGYYGDVDGIWSDTTVNTTTSPRAANKNIPGDGKFDQSILPSAVEVAVGRIDMWNMPAFAPLTEVDLLRRYLQKVENFRMAKFQPVRRALIDDHFGERGSEAFSTAPWNWFGSIVGRSSIFQKDWRTEFSNGQNYLWAYGCGGGSFTSIAGVDTTQAMAAGTIEAVFTSTFGSYFGDWNTQDNILRAPLAAAGKALSNTWSGRGDWIFHSQASGEPMATSILQTMNLTSGYYASTGVRSVHIGFMGDVTLRDLMIAPVQNVRVQKRLSRPVLRWDQSVDTMARRYYVYGSNQRNGRYALLTPNSISMSAYIPSTSFKFYMIRSTKIENRYGGQYENLSIGQIVQALRTPN